MSKSKPRTKEEARLSEVLRDITGSIIDAETLLGLVEPDFEIEELGTAQMIGHFLSHTGRRIINLCEQANHIHVEIQGKPKAA